MFNPFEPTKQNLKVIDPKLTESFAATLPPMANGWFSKSLSSPARKTMTAEVSILHIVRWRVWTVLISKAALWAVIQIFCAVGRARKAAGQAAS